MSTSAAVEVERNRRERMWRALEEIQVERPLKSEEVRELGCYGSARGIWRDTKETKHLTPSGCGVAVGISSRGKYEDEFTDETARYRYPLTQQRGQDEGDIRSLRWALEFNLPLFLIRSANAKGELTHSGKFRSLCLYSATTRCNIDGFKSTIRIIESQAHSSVLRTSPSVLSQELLPLKPPTKAP